jgi:hypothetical protein
VSRRAVIDEAAEALSEGAPVFTKRNLFFAARRLRGSTMTEARFRAELTRHLVTRRVPGLLPDTGGAQARRKSGVLFPEVVLLVDRPELVRLLVALSIGDSGVAVIAVDGTPASLVDTLKAGFRKGRRAGVLYLHDATTVVYPFVLEPLATLMQRQRTRPVPYVDLGLPPLGAPGRRFGDPTLDGGEPIVDLEEIPPAALLRYCVEAARRLTARGAPLR